jgi:acyl-coenzyme A thioesterase PaaI-like protein
MDSAGACAAHTLLPIGVGYATLETKGNFSTPIAPQTGRVRAEARVVAQEGPIISAEVHTTLREQIFHVAVAEGKAKVEPHCVPDDCGRKLVAGKRDSRHSLS